MRSSRLVITVLAALVALVMSLSLTSAQATDASARARQPHVIKNLKADEYGQTGKFFVRGQVTTYKNKVVKLQKKRTKNGSYRAFKTDRTDRTGRFKINFDGPRGSCYRVLVPGTTTRKPAYRPIGCIVAG